MRPFIAILPMVLIITVSPVLAGWAPPCVKTVCGCAAMTETHGDHLAPGRNPDRCDCRATGTTSCCMTENQSPELPYGALPLDRSAFPSSLAAFHATVTTAADAPGARRGPVQALPGDGHAPPPVYLLTQRFLI